jgi:hypothetical protein
MVSKSKGNGVQETVMVLRSTGYGVKNNGDGVRE